MRSPGVKPVVIDGLILTVIGPNAAEIAKLQADFERYLVEKGLAATAALAAATITQDNSPTNLSSIACLASFGDRRILLTGDARGDRILEGLQALDLLPGGRMEVDILKVQHHGSARNMKPDFFRAIRAETYVISADGKHSNPDRATIEAILDARDPADAYHLAFTYPLADIDETRRRLGGGDWTPEANGIEALIQRRKADGHAFTFSEGRHVIDLGDETVDW
jgi:hypothetical protein